MRCIHLLSCTGLICLATAALLAVSETERVRNGHVAVYEYALGPSGVLTLEGTRPAVTVYLDGGAIAQGDEFASKQLKVVSGQAVFSAAGAQTIRNVGGAALRFVRVEFAGSGSGQSWGTAGLAPNYKLLLENNYARVYDIRIPARATEKQHTHHDRVVICLSGAKLKHELPDGKEETATLKTGEIVWRLGATHVGHNLGDTDLWVVAVEPK
jgi:quercetin dioxygenase-like cupin family protein